MLDSNILCNDPFVMSLHQSHKDYCQWYYKVLYRRLLQYNSLDMMSLTQSTFLWTSFCIKVSNLDIDFQYSIANMDTFPYFPYDNSFLIESYLFVMMSIWSIQYGNISIISIWQLILNRIFSIHNNVDMVHSIPCFQLLTSNQSSSNFGLSFDSCLIILVKTNSSPFSF